MPDEKAGNVAGLKRIASARQAISHLESRVIDCKGSGGRLDIHEKIAVAYEAIGEIEGLK